MKVNDLIAKEYWEGRKISGFSDMWYFTNSAVAGDQNRNIFTEPSYDEEHREKVRGVCRDIQKVASNFIPTNIAIWDMIFPDWKNKLADIVVDLIVGFPQPYDATVERDKEGKHHVIFDVGLWTNYVDKCDIRNIVQNLITHELFHVLIGLHISNIDEDIVSSDYITNLDANTFHEAFAHLVSFNAKEIDTVDWHTEEFETVRKNSCERMRSALVETDDTARMKNLYDAVCGNYYEKFACMSGMLYLVMLWEKGGIPALNECFHLGYHQFASRTLGLEC